MEAIETEWLALADPSARAADPLGESSRETAETTTSADLEDAPPQKLSSPHPRTLSQALNQRIRELCKARGWSQRQFAKHLGVTQGAISYLLAEKRRQAAL